MRKETKQEADLRIERDERLKREKVFSKQLSASVKRLGEIAQMFKERRGNAGS